MFFILFSVIQFHNQTVSPWKPRRGCCLPFRLERPIRITVDNAGSLHRFLLPPRQEEEMDDSSLNALTAPDAGNVPPRGQHRAIGKQAHILAGNRIVRPESAAVGNDSAGNRRGQRGIVPVGSGNIGERTSCRGSIQIKGIYQQLNILGAGLKCRLIQNFPTLITVDNAPWR